MILYNRQITTPEERAELKELFNKHHKGYLKLFEKVNGVVSEFTRLTEQLENHEPDSPEYKVRCTYKVKFHIP
jgi:hypothetical protein